MKRLLLAVLAIVILSGCEPYQQEKTGFPLPPELKDCKIYRLSDGNTQITVMRCPNSMTSTTYQEGKATVSVIMIDGVEYIKKEN